MLSTAFTVALEPGCAFSSPLHRCSSTASTHYTPITPNNATRCQPSSLQPALCLPIPAACTLQDGIPPVSHPRAQAEVTLLSCCQLSPQTISVFITMNVPCNPKKRQHGWRQYFHSKHVSRRKPPPKGRSVWAPRILVNGCWPIRIQSIYLDEQKSNLLMSLMQVALVERARPENQDTRISNPAFSLCDLVQISFLIGLCFPWYTLLSPCVNLMMIMMQINY